MSATLNFVPANSAPMPIHASGDVAANNNTQIIGELVSAAIARFRSDLESYRPTLPALSFGLAKETHEIMVKGWRRYPLSAQLALLTGLLREVSSLQEEFSTKVARISPYVHMYGESEETLKLETLAEITLEEMRHIETDLRKLLAREVLH